jgi:branched-chain amino acid transport system substrate-binding protein
VPGVPWSQGLSAAVKAANASGGINGHKINLVTIDSAGSTTTATTAYRQITESDHVLAIGGMGDSAIDVALQPLAARDHVTLVESGTPSNELTSPYVIPYTPASQVQAKAIATYLLSRTAQAATGGPPKAAIVGFDDPDGHGFASIVASDIKAGGGTVVGQYFVSPTETDFTSVAAKMHAAGADAFAAQPDAVHEILLMKDLKAVGFSDKLPIASFSWSQSTSVPWAMYANVADYKTTGSAPGTLAYRKAATAAGHSPGTPYLVEGYASGEFLLNGLKACGWPCTGAQLYNKLLAYNGDLDGLAFGPFTNSSAGHYGPTSVAMQQYSGQGKPISYTALFKYEPAS